MLIPKHCSNPKCHRPYVNKGVDYYRDVLLRIVYHNGETENRVISVCKDCLKRFDLKMAENIMTEIVPVIINNIENDITIPQSRKKMMTEKFIRPYKIKAWGRDIDELNKRIKH